MKIKILALSGSLRAASTNSMLLRAVAKLAPAGIEVLVFQGLGELPLFNPDLEAQPPANVTTFFQAVAEADALLIASPEYAHGVSGTIKNALDWLVGFEPFAAKFVGAFWREETPRSISSTTQSSSSIPRTWTASWHDGSCLRSA